ncbi:MAG: PVC-type heme-binding CxxCH protein [Planctomycetota bacterium]
MRLRALFLTASCILSPAAGAPAQSPGRAEFRAGDVIALVGNALAERLQHDGQLEARLQLRLPELGLSLRNLGFSGDEVAIRQRTAGFGEPDEHLARIQASVVFAFFGYVESFGGTGELRRFRSDLERYVDQTLATRRLVLFSPVPCEDLGDPLLPASAAENARIAPYAAVIADVARARGVPFVDLFARMPSVYEASTAPHTIDGIHLNERGHRALTAVIESVLLGDRAGVAPDTLREQAILALVREKDQLWFQRYQVTDGYNVYGERSKLAYVDGVTNFDVLQRELESIDARCANLDRRIWEIARGAAEGSVPRVPVPPLIPVVTNRPGEGPGGAHVFLSGLEAIGRMSPAPGLDIGLFADEGRFPELAKPVQMSFDTCGRLWVAAWPSYPHARPDQPAHDKLLVLEDVDGDGRADKCQAFASDLQNPTGFEFWDGGVIVANAPDLLFLRDTDGDGVADERERILHGLSSADTHHSANSFVLGPDGALYFQEGIFHRSQIETIHGVVRQKDGCVWRFEPRTLRVERYAPYGFLNPHGHVFDRWGQDFITDGTGNENFFALPITGFLPAPRQHARTEPFFQQRSRPAGGTEILSSTHFPAEFQGDYLIANVIGFQGIFRYGLREEDSGFGAVERDPIVHSSNANFRPVDLEVGPDGALYFLDWHNPLIGHMQHHLRDPSRDQKHGRVYRVTCRGRALSKPAAIAGRPIPELLELLKSPEDRVRYRVRIELSSRPSDEVAAAARAWVKRLDDSDAQHEHDLLEALWVLQQHQVVDRPLLERVLRSPEPRARAAATRVARHLRRELGDPLPLLRARIEDDHARVRLEALVALSFVPRAEAAEVALRVLREPMDRFLDYALAETMAALESQWRTAIASGESFAAQDPLGLAWVLSRTDTDVLATLPPSEAIFEQLVERYGLETSEYVRAARGLAAMRATDAAGVLVAAIERADTQDGGHTDHLLGGLFQALADVAASDGRLPGSTVGSPRPLLVPSLSRLAREGRRSSTRRLATAVGIDLGGSVESAWNEAARSPTALCELLEALPHVHTPGAAQELFPRVVARLERAPAMPADTDGAVRGRYVRVELPGAQRTLTLAEVEVLHGGTNHARTGTATQSTTNWGGGPERAIDGNTSGAWTDGGQTHTIEDRPDPWWEVDLGALRSIDRLVLWNRTDDEFESRLDGALLIVLDGERRTVFQAQAAEAGASLSFELTSAGLRVRRAAARATAALATSPERAAAAVRALVAQCADPDLRGSAVAALRSIPGDRWPEETERELAQSILALLQAQAAGEVEREVLAFADELADPQRGLDAALARELRVARRRAGPQVAVIRPVPDSLLYDRTQVAVVAGRRVELVFQNVDIMPHNLVVTARGALARVGMAAERMSASPDAWSKAFVPDSDEVLHATRLLLPGESQTLAFTAPAEPGDYPYVCTFPGHWMRMNGILRVVASDSEIDEAAPPQAAAAGAPSRAFVRNWTVAELLPDLASLPQRDPVAGRRVLETASCLRCHAIGTEGGTTGPELRAVVQRYLPDELLQHVLEPSRQIAPEYLAQIFSTTDGRIVAGRVVSQDERGVRVQIDPYGGPPEDLLVEDIEERVTSSVSIMPSGLLSTFQRDEIGDLIAYLVSLKP